MCVCVFVFYDYQSVNNILFIKIAIFLSVYFGLSFFVCYSFILEKKKKEEIIMPII